MTTTLRRLLIAALIAGGVAGLVVGALQLAVVTPLIHQAEAFEVHDQSHDTGADHWSPQEGFERAAYTVLFNVLAGIGFGLLLNAGLLLAGSPTISRSLLWGLAGFAVFGLAPALGLPPELPGTPAGGLLARQVWWVGTAFATAGGLALLTFARPAWIKLLGIALLILPHAIGAPSTPGLASSPVQHLEQPFILASLGTTAVFWLALGALSGWLQSKLGLGSTQQISLASSA